MSNAKWRSQTFTELGREGLNWEASSKLLRYSATLQRLAEANCNGDWPADNGQRKVKPCSKCGGLWAPSVLLKGGICPDCRTEDRVREVCKVWNIVPEFQGDPRGAVLSVKFPNGRTVAVCG